MNQLTTIDLFSGAGGLAEGFRSQGYRVLFANDHEKPAMATFARNHPAALVNTEDIESLEPGRVRDALGLEQGELSVLLGGPPCQGFSTYGKRDPEDPRNGLFRYYLAFLKEFRPKAFVMENVVGLLSMEGGRVIEMIQEGIDSLGYTSRAEVLDAADYGVPQFRKRVFLVGARDGVDVPFPPPTHGLSNGQQATLFAASKELPPHLTVRDAIGDMPEVVLKPKQTHEVLPYPSNGRLSEYQTQMRTGSEFLLHHSAKQMLGIRRLRLALLRPGDYGADLRHRLENDGLPDEVIDELLYGKAELRDLAECRKEDRKKEKELRVALREGHMRIDDLLDSGGFANKYRRLEWDSPSHTLVAHMARDCSDFIHPELDRFISVREAARLQSFPDSYYFDGSQFRQFRAIGNAVPPRLGAALASSVSSVLNLTAAAAGPRETS